MDQVRARQLLAQAGAVIEGHFVGTSGNHLSMYVAKDRATRLTSVVSELCAGIAEAFAADDVEAVVAPAVGGIALSQWIAHHLTRLRPDRPEVLALYTEHDDLVLEEGKGDGIKIELPSGGCTAFPKGAKIILRRPRFVLKRGFDRDVCGLRVLAAEDTLTTGGSAASTVQAIVEAGGIIVGLGALANGGKVTAEMVGVPRLEALVEIERLMYTEAECLDHGLCRSGVLVNTNFGHGAAFLARQATERGPSGS